MKKLLLLGLVLIVGTLLYYQTAKEKNNPKNDTSQSTENNQPIKDKQTVHHYKDIFKEPKEPNKFKAMQKQQEIKSLDENVEKLLAKARKTIKDNNLVLAKKEITQEDKKKIEKLNKKLEILKQKAEELNHEN